MMSGPLYRIAVRFVVDASGKFATWQKGTISVNNSKIMTTITSVAIHRENENCLFGETATTVRLDDEGGGAFIVIEQVGNDWHTTSGHEIRIDSEELDAIYYAAKMLIEQDGAKEK
jgi:hypothetical protein